MSKYKAFLRIAAMVLVAFGVLAGLGFVERGGGKTPVRDIAVEVKGASGVHFLDKDMLLKQVVGGTGPVIGTPIAQLDEAGIEHRLRAIPCIADVEVYHGLDGIVHVNATQREPVLRVINADGSGFYIDKNGFTMPLSLRTNCSAAARISSSVAGGAKLASVLMLRHMGDRLRYSMRTSSMTLPFFFSVTFSDSPAFLVTAIVTAGYSAGATPSLPARPCQTPTRNWIPSAY